MSSHHTTNGHATNGCHSAAPAAPAASSATPSRPTGRPRAFDDAMRREVCALITAGCDLRYAARYVGCSLSTLRRELQRNDEFSAQIRRAEAGAAIHPLVAMNQAASTHWRAAAWMLERTMPERFARPAAKKFSQRQAKQLISDLVELLRAETMPPIIRERLEKRVTALVEHTTNTSSHPALSARRLRDALRDTRGRLPDRPQLPDDFLPPMPADPLSILDGNYSRDRQLWDEAFAASRQPDHPEANLHADDPPVATQSADPTGDTLETHPPAPHAADSASRKSPDATSARPDSGAENRDLTREPAAPARRTQEQTPHQALRPTLPLAPSRETAFENPIENSLENSKIPPSDHGAGAVWPEFSEDFRSSRPAPLGTFARKNAHAPSVQNPREPARAT